MRSELKWLLGGGLAGVAVDITAGFAAETMSLILVNNLVYQAIGSTYLVDFNTDSTFLAWS